MLSSFTWANFVSEVLGFVFPNHESSVLAAFVRLVYLTITYQLVKLLATTLKKAAKNRVECRYMKCIFWNRGVMEIGMNVVRKIFRLVFLLPSSGK